MTLPPFEQFMASLDPETVSGIMRDANNAAKIAASTDGINPLNVPGLQAQAMSFQVALELLAVYHKWLEQEL